MKHVGERYLLNMKDKSNTLKFFILQGIESLMKQRELKKQDDQLLGCSSPKGVLGTIAHMSLISAQAGPDHWFLLGFGEGVLCQALGLSATTRT